MIDLIIPVFNVPSYTSVCLDSLYSVDHGCNVRPIVVDNGSRKKTKGVIEEWKTRWSGLSQAQKDICSEPKVVTLDKNYGFAGGINAGMDVSTTERVVVMHNDVVPFGGWCDEMRKVFADAQDDVGCVIPRTSYSNEHGPCIDDVRERFRALKPSNKERIDPDEIVALVDKCYPEGRQEFVNRIRQAKPQFMYSPEVASFCMMLTRENFEKYGKFDTDFWPRGFEDKYFWRKMERDGWVCLLAVRGYVHHFGNITSDGPGFNVAETMKANDEKFKAKCAASDKEAIPKLVSNGAKVPYNT